MIFLIYENVKRACFRAHTHSHSHKTQVAHDDDDDDGDGDDDVRRTIIDQVFSYNITHRAARD